MKIKEEREAKRASLDGRHEFILSTVGDKLGMTIEETEDFMLVDDQVSVGQKHIGDDAYSSCVPLAELF